MEKPGVLQSMGLQRVRHDLATEQQPQNVCLYFVQKKKKGDIILPPRSNLKTIGTNLHPFAG